jgi:hypothetical protein
MQALEYGINWGVSSEPVGAIYFVTVVPCMLRFQSQPELSFLLLTSTSLNVSKIDGQLLWLPAVDFVLYAT